MISVENALQTVLNTTQDFGVEEIPFLTSLGRILKEDILADRDFPPFHRVSMDGIVIDFEEFKKGQRSFKIAGVQPAGGKEYPARCKGSCSGWTRQTKPYPWGWRT